MTDKTENVPARTGKWWAGRVEEWFTVGPLDSRDDALHEGQIIAEEYEQDHFYIAEAEVARVKFDASRLIESQYFENEDWFDYENVEPDRLGDAKTADRELQELLDAWTAKHSATFVQPSLFLWSRSEHIELAREHSQ